MTATTSDRITPIAGAELLAVPVAANTVILAGTIVCANAAGFATPGAPAATLTYLGMADCATDNTGGADGAATVIVRRGKSFRWENDSSDPVTQASVGKACYVSDNQTVAKTNGSNARSAAGIVLAVDSDGVWVFA